MVGPQPTPPALKILLVEDNADVAEIMCILLERLGHRVVHVSSIAQAVQKYEGGGFGLIISDHRLPDGLASALLGKLKSPQPVRAILLSAANPDDIPAELRDGFICCLQKPVDSQGLAAAIELARSAAPPTV